MLRIDEVTKVLADNARLILGKLFGYYAEEATIVFQLGNNKYLLLVKESDDKVDFLFGYGYNMETGEGMRYRFEGKTPVMEEMAAEDAAEESFDETHGTREFIIMLCMDAEQAGSGIRLSLKEVV